VAIDLSKAVEKMQSMVNEGIAALPNLAIAIVVFAIFVAISRVVRTVVRRLFDKIGRSANVGSLIGRLGQAAVIMIGILISAPIVVPSFQAADVVKVLGLGGVAVGFAFKDIFQNFFAGVLILLTDPFRVGDQIVVQNYEGTVERIETRSTTITTYDNRRVVIPNADLYTKSVLVETAFGGRRTTCQVVIGYDDDIDNAKKVILKAIKEIDGVLGDPAPSVVAAKLEDATVTLNVSWWSESQRSKVGAAQDKVLAALKQANMKGPSSPLTCV
jgi:small conductance mechanosensitive channel